MAIKLLAMQPKRQLETPPKPPPQPDGWRIRDYKTEYRTPVNGGGVWLVPLDLLRQIEIRRVVHAVKHPDPREHPPTETAFVSLQVVQLNTVGGLEQWNPTGEAVRFPEAILSQVIAQLQALAGRK